MQRLADIVARRQKAGTVPVVLGGAPCKLTLPLFDCSRFHPMTPDSRPRRIPRVSPIQAAWQKSKVIKTWICWDLRKAASLSRARSFSVHPINDTLNSPLRLTRRFRRTVLSISYRQCSDRLWAREVAEKISLRSWDIRPDKG